MRNPIQNPARRLAALGGAGLTLFASAAAYAADAHGDPLAPSPVPWNDATEAIVNFAIFVFLLYYFLRKPVMEFLAQRRMKLAADIEESERLRDEAEKKLADYATRLERIDAERAEILEGYRVRAEEERKAILAEARAVAERMKTEAKVAMEQELVRARAQLKERIVEEAVELARQKLRDRMDAQTNARLVDEYTTQLRRIPQTTPHGGA